MASMRDIKRRKGSIQSTQQITKAMKLVSTVKLQRARQNAERSRDYFTGMYETVTSILAKTAGMRHPYLNGSSTGKKAIVVMTNVVKLITRGDFRRDEVVIYAVGKKGRDALARAGYEIAEDLSEIAEEPAYPDAMRLSGELLAAFSRGEISGIYLAYTKFKNTVTHVPVLMRLLPVEIPEDARTRAESAGAPMNFEMEDEEALNLLIPKYITSLIYGGLVEAAASENGARMQAMDSATGNAEEMISSLSLQYNRARQSSITQELTEIIAGANAIT